MKIIKDYVALDDLKAEIISANGLRNFNSMKTILKSE